MTNEPSKSIMRSLGEFFGHIVKGVRTDPTAQPTSTTAHGPGASRHVVRRSVEEVRRDTPEGAMTMRRITIDEVEIEHPAKSADEQA